MCSFAPVQVAGGPKIPLRFGRKDADGPESPVPEGNLPGILIQPCSKWEQIVAGHFLPSTHSHLYQAPKGLQVHNLWRGLAAQPACLSDP